MKKKWTIAMKLLLALVTVLAASVAWAELTATVSPGYTFATGERPTTSTLNRLGNPTILISGTLDGTNAGISAGSINANMFAANVVDNVSIDFTNSSPQALRIKSAGVGVREISSAIAGSGLAGGSGSVLSVSVDDAGIAITNDVLTLKTNLNPNYLGVASNSVVVGTSTNRGVAMGVDVFAKVLKTNSFVSSDFTLSAGLVANTAHGLGVRPSVVRWVFVAANANAGYSAGDEVDAACFNTTFPQTAAVFGANETNVWLALSTTTLQGYNKTNPAVGFTSLTASDWRARCYARP